MRTKPKPLCTRNWDGKQFRWSDQGDGTVFVYSPRSTRWGWEYGKEEFERLFTAEDAEAKERRLWERHRAQIVSRLEASGLWENLLPFYRGLGELGYDGLKETREAHKATYALPLGEGLEKRRRLAEQFEADHPALRGHYTDCICELGDCAVKAMYFGRDTPRARERIARALAAGAGHREWARTSYDVSYSYDPDQKKAWYSEEFKDTGNGHYFLAIDASHCVFCEDD